MNPVTYFVNKTICQDAKLDCVPHKSVPLSLRSIPSFQFGIFYGEKEVILYYGNTTPNNSEGVAELPLLKLLRIEYFEPKYDFSILI